VTELFTTENLAALLTLAALEIVLGIDNIVFISILSEKVEKSRQKSARRTGLILAMVARIVLLFGISWIMGLKKELFAIPIVDHGISGRDLILIAGGGFLLAKATHEIHDKIEGSQETLHQPKASASFASVIAQILMLDLVFSLDSVITAVGMVPVPKGPGGEDIMWIPITVMVTAIVIAIIVMLIFAEPIAGFIRRHPTTKMLALAFLFMIGMVLVADGFGQHIPKGYIYSAIVFSLVVEALNLRVQKVRQRRQKAAAS